MLIHVTTRQGATVAPPFKISSNERPLSPDEEVGFLLTQAARQAILDLGAAGGALRLDDGPPVPCRARMVENRLAVEMLVDGYVLDADTTPVAAIQALADSTGENDAEAEFAADIEAGFPQGRLYVAVLGLPPSTGGIARVIKARDLPDSEASDAVIRLDLHPGDWPCHLLPSAIDGSVATALAEGVTIFALPATPVPL
jgi:hypothetical protein